MKNPTEIKNEQTASDTLKLVYEGKQLTKYVPKGESPKLYIDLIKAQVMKPSKDGKERSNADLLLFLYTAKRTGLDPLTRQIYAVFRWDSRQGKEVMGIQSGIDGMRLVAQRSGQYAGQDDAVFTPEDESTKYPTKATVTIYKMINGARCPFTASARWNEYAPVKEDKNTHEMKPEFMWDKMPYTMLGKCAEALALRKGFPNELSGVYAEEEMRQALPTESQEISNLPAPKREHIETVHNVPVDENNNEIRVDHGAPSDISQTPKIVTPENIDQFADKLNGEDSPAEVQQVISQPETTAIMDSPDLAAMRDKLKPKLSEEEQADLDVKERQRRALELANEAKAKQG